MIDKFVDQDAKKNILAYKWSFERSLMKKIKTRCQNKHRVFVSDRLMSRIFGWIGRIKNFPENMSRI
jgi:hypothetical protein